MIRTISIATLALSLGLGGLAAAPQAALAAAPPAAAPAPPAAAPPPKVEELYSTANKLYDEGKLVEAEVLYRKVWAIRKSYDVASNLGALELDLGKPAAAAGLLSYALRQFPVDRAEKSRAALQVRFESARKLSCTLRLKVSEAGADISVDGTFVGKAPLADELFVQPGSRTIAITMNGRRNQQVIKARAGAEQELTLTLAPIPARIATPAAAPVATAETRSKVPGIIAGAAGVVALGVGSTLIALAESNRSDAETLHDSIQGTAGRCSARPDDCAALRDHTRRADSLGNAGIGVLVGGGALAAAGVIYLLWPASKPAPTTRDAGRASSARITPTVRATFGASPQGGGVTLLGSF